MLQLVKLESVFDTELRDDFVECGYSPVITNYDRDDFIEAGSKALADVSIVPWPYDHRGIEYGDIIRQGRVKYVARTATKDQFTIEETMVYEDREGNYWFPMAASGKFADVQEVSSAWRACSLGI